MKFTKRQVDSSSNGNSNFLKLENGVPVVGIFRGEVHEFWQVWPQGGQKEVYDHHVPGSQSRFKANFVVIEPGKPLVPKIFEFPLAIYNQLAGIAEVYEITETKLQITKHVNGKKTTYMLLPIVSQQLTDAQKKALEAVNLHILNGGREVSPAPAPQTKASPIQPPRSQGDAVKQMEKARAVKNHAPQSEPPNYFEDDSEIPF